MKNKSYLLFIAFIVIISISLSFISFSLAQYIDEPEITYYNSLENRTSISDTYLIKKTDYKNGTILKKYQAQIYSSPVNILDNGTYNPFTEVVDLKWNELSESFILSWQGKQIKIKPIIFDNLNNEYTIGEIKNIYPSINFNYNIEKSRKYKYGIMLSNLSNEFQQNIKSIKFSLEGLQGLTFNDIESSENSIVIKDLIEVYFDYNSAGDLNYVTANKSLNVDNVGNKSEINVKMMAGLI